MGGIVLRFWRGGLWETVISSATMRRRKPSSCKLLTLIFVAPFTDFSKELAIATQRDGSANATEGAGRTTFASLFSLFSKKTVKWI
jgi:hypothetical protein